MIKRSERFEFDWHKEKRNQVYKIVEKYQDTPEILGLISISDIAEELRIHVNLVESADENKGKTRKLIM